MQGETNSGLERKFADLADVCFKASREISEAFPPGCAASEQNVLSNLEIVRTMFSKWFLDILTLLYTRKSVGFRDIQKLLSISSRMLTLKLRQMEERDLVHREVRGTRPFRVQYSLTRKGLLVAKLGEPVLLYLRMTEGILMPPPSESTARAPRRSRPGKRTPPSPSGPPSG